MKKVLSILKWIVVVILLAILGLNIYVVVQSKTHPDKIPSVFGYKPFIVLSGSMESNISVGDLVIVKETDVDKLKVNDIIAFRDDEDLVTTHRIIEVVEQDNDVCFKTKGDANNTEDEGLVCSKYVEGKFAKKYAKIGNAILFIQEPLGLAIMLMAIFIICVLWYLLENRKINKELGFESEKERKEFEEYKKMKEQQEKDNN